jgi:uncharacterized protein YoxC
LNLSDPRLLNKAQASFVSLKKEVTKTLQATDAAVDATKRLELKRLSEQINCAINEIEASINFQELPQGQLLTLSSFNRTLEEWGVTLDTVYSEVQGIKAYVSAKGKRRSS